MPRAISAVIPRGYVVNTHYAHDFYCMYLVRLEGTDIINGVRPAKLYHSPHTQLFRPYRYT